MRERSKRATIVSKLFELIYIYLFIVLLYKLHFLHATFEMCVPEDRNVVNCAAAYM